MEHRFTNLGLVFLLLAAGCGRVGMQPTAGSGALSVAESCEAQAGHDDSPDFDVESCIQDSSEELCRADEARCNFETGDLCDFDFEGCVRARQGNSEEELSVCEEGLINCLADVAVEPEDPDRIAADRNQCHENFARCADLSSPPTCEEQQASCLVGIEDLSEEEQVRRRDECLDRFHCDIRPARACQERPTGDPTAVGLEEDSWIGCYGAFVGCEVDEPTYGLGTDFCEGHYADCLSTTPPLCPIEGGPCEAGFNNCMDSGDASVTLAVCLRALDQCQYTGVFPALE